jgi:hypothetical protein
MSRLISGTPDTPVESLGQILRVGLDEEPAPAYFIHEEEVPRARAIVTCTYQRTRWHNGQIYIWQGRAA